MSSIKKVIGPAWLGAALSIFEQSYAMNVGESGSLLDIQIKLANEKQVEIATGAAGKIPNLRGVSFYYSEATKIGYIALTNDPIRPTQGRIIFKTKKTTTGASIDFGDPNLGSIRCEQLIAQKLVSDTGCSSFKDTLDVAQSAGMKVFQQGILPTLNILTIFMNTSTGTGVVFESTVDGATVSKLVTGNTKLTNEGERITANKY
jgi:hypothetical protein